MAKRNITGLKQNKTRHTHTHTTTPNPENNNLVLANIEVLLGTGALAPGLAGLVLATRKGVVKWSQQEVWKKWWDPNALASSREEPGLCAPEIHYWEREREKDVPRSLNYSIKVSLHWLYVD